MSEDADPPDGWTVWSEEGDRIIYAFRPDIFDAADFPAPCLPVCYLTRGKRTRRPGRHPGNRPTADDWFVTLYLEPEVVVGDVQRFDARVDAEAFAIERMERFATGAVDYRDAYQVPRERYLDRLDDLTDSAPN